MFKGVVLTGRIELPTPSLPRKCSTTELRQPIIYSLTKGLCVKKSAHFNTSEHLKIIGGVGNFEPCTRSGVASHNINTPDSTIQRFNVTDRDSDVLVRCVRKTT